MHDDDEPLEAHAEPIDAQFEPAPPAPSRRRSGPGWLGLALAASLAAMTGGLIAVAADWFNGSAPAALARNVGRMESDQRSMELQLKGLTEQQAELKQNIGGEDFNRLIADLAAASQRLDEALASSGGPEAVAALERRVAAMEAADNGAPLGNRQMSRSLAALEARLATVEDLLRDARAERAAIDTLAVRLAQAEATIESLRASGGAATPSALSMPGLEAYLDSVRRDEAAAREKADRAESHAEAAMALASLERAAERGASFESDYRALRTLRPASPAIRRLGMMAAKGAPTRAALKASFAKAERMARRGISEEADKGLGWLPMIFGDAVSVRTKDGGDSSAQALNTARNAMSGGELEKALNALSGLTGEPAAAMADWLAEARQRADLDSALDAARNELLGEEDKPE